MAKWIIIPNSDLDGYIDVLRRKIAAGYLVEAHQKMLDKLLAIKAEIPFVSVIP